LLNVFTSQDNSIVARHQVSQLGSIQFSTRSIAENTKAKAFTMHIRRWIGVLYATLVSFLLLQAPGQELDILSARLPTPDDLCDGNLYCYNGYTKDPVWRNEYGFEMPTKKLWEENLDDDKRRLENHFNKYKY
jgi:hypothetical protein